METSARRLDGGLRRIRGLDMAGNREEDDMPAWAEDQCVWGFLEGFKSLVNLRLSSQQC